MHELQAISILGSGLIALVVAWAMAVGMVPAPLASPNARSLHTHPVPRIGGVAIWAGWMLAWTTVPVAAQWVVPFAIVVAVSLIDDLRGLSATARLLVQAAAAVTVAGSFLHSPDWLCVIFDALVIVWMANLYNFMDGADGLAGGMGISGFGAYAIAASWGGYDDFALLCASLAAACAGFVVFNRPPARLFMGDVGAVALGFLAALFGLDGHYAGLWPWWFPPLIFAPFIFDATVTLLGRGWRRAPVARAHREHFYQKAILIDGRHGRTVGAYGWWMAGCAMLALAGLRWSPDFGGLLLVIAVAGFGWYCWNIDRRWASRSDAHHGG